jgi:hypothetical protein
VRHLRRTLHERNFQQGGNSDRVFQRRFLLGAVWSRVGTRVRQRALRGTLLSRVRLGGVGGGLVLGVGRVAVRLSFVDGRLRQPGRRRRRRRR